jgi:metallo-beta-lactamase class B
MMSRYLHPSTVRLLSLFCCCITFAARPLPLHAQTADSLSVVRGVEFVKMADGVWRHISHLLFEGASVPSNGLIIEAPDELLMIDTPCNDTQTDSLLRWAKKTFDKPLRKVIATHAHEDRLGGMATLQRQGIDVMTTPLTAQWAAKRGFAAPRNPTLPNDTTFRFGRFTVRVLFPGGGHTVDNIVVWIAEPRILVGGCLLKTASTQSVGFIGDAVLNEWVQSVRNVAMQFNTATVVVPGHGDTGSTELYQHTVNIIETYLKRRNENRKRSGG